MDTNVNNGAGKLNTKWNYFNKQFNIAVLPTTGNKHPNNADRKLDVRLDDKELLQKAKNNNMKNYSAEEREHIWRASRNTRMTEIRELKNTGKSIYDEWPAYRLSIGYEFVNIFVVIVDM